MCTNFRVCGTLRASRGGDIHTDMSGKDRCVFRCKVGQGLESDLSSLGRPSDGGHAPVAHTRSNDEYEMRIGRTLLNYGLRCMRRTRLWKRGSERMLSYAGSAFRYSQTSRCSTARSSQRSAASLSPRGAESWARELAALRVEAFA